MASLCKFDQSDVYDGKVVGLFTPLELTETDDEIAVKGGTFRYAISKKTGQIVSANVLDTEYLAKGEMLPDQVRCAKFGWGGSEDRAFWTRMGENRFRRTLCP